MWPSGRLFVGGSGTPRTAGTSTCSAVHHPAPLSLRQPSRPRVCGWIGGSRTSRLSPVSGQLGLVNPEYTRTLTLRVNPQWPPYVCTSLLSEVVRVIPWLSQLQAITLNLGHVDAEWFAILVDTIALRVQQSAAVPLQTLDLTLCLSVAPGLVQPRQSSSEAELSVCRHASTHWGLPWAPVSRPCVCIGYHRYRFGGPRHCWRV